MLARRCCSYRCRGQKETQEQHLASIGSAYGQSPNWNPCRQMCLASCFLPEWLMLSVKRQLCDRSKVSRVVEPNKRNTHVCFYWVNLTTIKPLLLMMSIYCKQQHL